PGQTIGGTASDANLTSYTLELANGPPALASNFRLVAAGETGLTAGTFALLPPVSDGVYTLRLTVRDGAGNQAVDLASFAVDLTPPAAPTGVAASAHVRDATVTWTASASPDVAGYVVERTTNSSSFFDQAATVSTTSFVDSGLSDQTYRYRISAIDQAGNVGSPSAEASVEIHGTPPLARIASPFSGAQVSGTVDVSGTASWKSRTGEYRLSVRAAASTTSQLLVRSSLPVVSGKLASFDAPSFPEGSQQVLRLEVDDAFGNTSA